ncbi:hypothetical protein [Pseudorhodoplanes sp.]|uniref:hypothetical protein n=1 Tax=Pseudorhodoplanes sp. TaxID=1934341 RepID=UPI002C323A2B|nr:hypothetical protein [Pseudorhodoplanes sp.]HWV43468.1 hypothetical protein [Pseudorhodoplanes sp.]
MFDEAIAAEASAAAFGGGFNAPIPNHVNEAPPVRGQRVFAIRIFGREKKCVVFC